MGSVGLAAYQSSGRRSRVAPVAQDAPRRRRLTFSSSLLGAGGNTDNDNRFASLAPASFELPNLITVAAVDRAGDEAAFTSYWQG